jgi:hypothetical protein
LARDLRTAFPDMRGFSPRNLKYMRALAEAWPGKEFVQQAVAIALVQRYSFSCRTRHAAVARCSQVFSREQL